VSADDAGVAALRADETADAGREDAAAPRFAELAGGTSSSVKKRSASGSAFDATLGAAGAGTGVALVAVPVDFAAPLVPADRVAAVVVVDFAPVAALAVVDFGDLPATEPPTLFRSFWTLLVTLLTCDFMPESSLPKEFFTSVASAIVFSNSPESSDVIRRKSRTARPAWPATSGSLPGPKMIKAATRMIPTSQVPIPKMFMIGLDVFADGGA